jgi:hypothetical protein
MLRELEYPLEYELEDEWLGEVKRPTWNFIRRALRLGREILAVRLAIARGLRDVNKLTNMVFFARYPERRGRRLKRHERRLVREWLDIRNRLVRPALAAASLPPSTRTVPPRSKLGPYPRVNTPLPKEGPGFYITRYEHRKSRRFGLPETIQALKAIGAAWQRAHPRGPRIGIGDISFRGGGKMPPHVSHKKGVDVDTRPMRNDGKEASVRYQSPRYSRALTQELVNLIRANGVLRVRFILFNDPAVKGVKPWSGHDNHLHIRFYPPR